MLIRTVTLHYTGQILSVTDSDIVLGEAAWIANTGRFADCLKSGFPTNAEIEPFPDRTIVARAGIIDVTEWAHSLPRAQK